MHGWRFDHSTGRCLNAPSKALSPTVVTVEDGLLWAEVHDEAHVDLVKQGRRATKLGLTVQLHAHACLEISYEGFTLLTDPWLDGPAFFGAWAPYPPHAVRGADLRPDAILITHEHSDHFHEPTLRSFDRHTPVYVPDFPNQRMPLRLRALGFTDVRPLRFGEPYSPRDGWYLTVFEPQSYWNDAFCLVDVDGFRILNLNDAGVNARIARMVTPVDVVAVQFSGGGSGYPWTWAHFTDEQKTAISERLCEGKLKLMQEAAEMYGASAVLPFASHFSLWHPSHREHARLMKRNRVSDVTRTLAGTRFEAIDLLPGDTWDVGNGVIRRATDDPALFSPERIAAFMDSPAHPAAFAEHHPTDETLSRAELVEYLQQLNEVPEIASCEDLTVRLQGHPSQPGRAALDVSCAIAGGRLRILPAVPDVVNLSIELSLGVLTATIRDGLSWDEAFVGYWCQFDRHPNVYHAGFWRLFQAPYFKRPVSTVAAASGGGIDLQSTMAEVLEAHGDDADRVLRRFGLYCSGCHHSTSDSIEMAARQHGLEPRRVELLLKELNRAFPAVPSKV